jgi:hypothetical protein
MKKLIIAVIFAMTACSILKHSKSVPLKLSSCSLNSAGCAVDGTIPYDGGWVPIDAGPQSWDGGPASYDGGVCSDGGLDCHACSGSCLLPDGGVIIYPDGGALIEDGGWAIQACCQCDYVAPPWDLCGVQGGACNALGTTGPVYTCPLGSVCIENPLNFDGGNPGLCQTGSCFTGTNWPASIGTNNPIPPVCPAPWIYQTVSNVGQVCSLCTSP